jgi:hypothetical protein
MTLRHDHTHTGVQLVAVMHAERAEPSAETFVVPPNTKSWTRQHPSHPEPDNNSCANSSIASEPYIIFLPFLTHRRLNLTAANVIILTTFALIPLIFLCTVALVLRSLSETAGESHPLKEGIRRLAIMGFAGIAITFPCGWIVGQLLHK